MKNLLTFTRKSIILVNHLTGSIMVINKVAFFISISLLALAASCSKPAEFFNYSLSVRGSNSMMFITTDVNDTIIFVDEFKTIPLNHNVGTHIEISANGYLDLKVMRNKDVYISKIWESGDNSKINFVIE